MRILKAGGALIALGILLFGVPWFLLQFAQPAYLLTANWVAALTVGADARLILALLAVVGWVAWAVLALTIVLEALAVLSRQRIRLQLPGTGWLRPMVGTLIVAVVASPTVASADAAGSPSEPSSVTAPVGAAAPVEPAEEVAPPTLPGRQYVVQPGDELWFIAAAELGSGARWREIVALNEGLTSESRLTAGTMLVLPEAVADARPTVLVDKGDTLWHIAESQLGDPTRWPEIHAENLARITDPDVIDIGWELRLPEATDTTAPSPPRAQTPAEEPTVETPAEHEAPTDAAARAVAEAFGSDFAVARGETPQPEAALEELDDELVESLSAADAADQELTDEYSGLLTPVGAMLASAVLVGVGTRRRAQILARAVGHRLVPLPAQVARFWTALGHRSEAAAAGQDASPTTLVLGWEANEPVRLNAEAERAVVFTGEEASAALGAALTGLACAPWSGGVEVITVNGTDWVAALDDPRITGEDTTAAGLQRLARLCAERRLALRDRGLAQVRAEADLAEAFRPAVVVFLTPLGPAELDAVGDALALGQVGVSVLASTTVALQLPFTQVHVDADQGSLRGRSFTPQLITEPARRALLELFSATGTLSTEPAPWWKDDDDLPRNVLPLPRPDQPEERAMTVPSSVAHPMLLLLGDIDITGAAGTLPSRAVGQCMEYCAWLLHNPGSTPTLMLRDLQVADTTRRSNMSRLRTWLGIAPDGAPYLPDAYSGRILLDDRVTSDWEQFNALLSGGVNLASTQALREALSLVRGEPLGTFSFQWHWAQQLQADMVAMIVDAACVLADRALALGDLDGALWAISQGRLGAPFDDALAVRNVEALRLAGRHDEADHAVVRLNRTLRADGRDLKPALALRIQSSLRSAAPRRSMQG